MSAWIAQRFPLYGRVCLAAGIFLTPIAVHRGLIRQFSVPKITILWFTGLTAMALWVVSSAERRAWLPRPRMAYPAVAFLGATALATWLSVAPSVSLVGLYDRHGGLIPLVVYLGIAVAIVALHWQHPLRLRWIAGAIAAGSVVVALSVLLQEAGLDRVLWPGRTPGTVWDYPVGTIGHSNFAGAQLGIALPMLWYLVQTQSRSVWRRVWCCLLVLDVLALWFTQSRGGMLAAAVGLGAMALANRDPLSRWASVAVGVGVAALLSVAGVMSSHPVTAGPDTRLGGIEALRTRTLEMRSFYWLAAGGAFLDHPIIGTGPDTFYAMYTRYRPAPAGVGNDAANFVDKPHNIFLERAASSGILGVGSYLLLVGAAVRYAYRRRRLLVGTDRQLLAAFVGALAGYLAQGFFSIDMPNVALLGWVAIAGVVTIADPALVAWREAASQEDISRGTIQRGSNEAAATTDHGVPGRTRWLVHIPVVVAVAALSVVGLRPLRAEIEAMSGDFTEATRLDPLNAALHAEAGRRAEMVGGATTVPNEKKRYLALARRQFTEALRLQPGSVVHMLDLANVECRWAADIDPGRFGQAERWWKQALAHDPRNRALRTNYDQKMAAAVHSAVAHFQATTALQPHDAVAWVNLAKAHVAARNSDKARVALAQAVEVDPANPAVAKLHADLGSGT